MPAGGPGGDGQSFSPARQISNTCTGKSFMQCSGAGFVASVSLLVFRILLAISILKIEKNLDFNFFVTS